MRSIASYKAKNEESEQGLIRRAAPGVLRVSHFLYLLCTGSWLILLPPAYVVRCEVMFSQVSVCTTFGAGGLPHLHPIILPLVPCPFRGVPHSQAGDTLAQGYPPARSGQGYLPARSEIGYPPPARTGVPPPPQQVTLGQVTPRAVSLLRFLAGGLSCLKWVFATGDQGLRNVAPYWNHCQMIRRELRNDQGNIVIHLNPHWSHPCSHRRGTIRIRL